MQEKSTLESQHGSQEADDLHLDEEIEQVTGREGEEEDEEGSHKGTQCSEKSSPSHELIHPNEVMKALRAFVEDTKQPPK